MHRLGAESGAQALHQLRHRRGAAATREEIARLGTRLDQWTATQPHAAHWPGQGDAREPHAQQRRDPRFRRHRLGKP